MQPIFICEDNLHQRRRMEAIIKDYIVINDIDMELVLSTDNPIEILDYIEKCPKQNALYILDIHLQHEMNGITLGSKVREKDIYAKIVFVTTHVELSYLAFQYKVEAMDYIIKNNPEYIAEKIRECLHVAHKRYLEGSVEKKYYKFKVGDKVRKIPFDEIMFFESHHMSHKLILHTTNSLLEFYGSLSEVAEIDPIFFRCHQSFVVNTKNIKGVNKVTREIEMINGEVVLVATKKIRKLIDALDM